jgi:hypothetical protein
MTDKLKIESEPSTLLPAKRRFVATHGLEPKLQVFPWPANPEDPNDKTPLSIYGVHIREVSSDE